MTIFIILSIIGSLITTVTIIRLFREQRFSQEAIRKLIVQEHLALKIKSENEKLSVQIAELTRANTELEKTFFLKEEELLQNEALIIKKISQIIEKIQVEEIMTKNVIAIHFEAPFSQVPRKMDENHIRHLPVIDDDGRLVGLLSQRMLYQIRSPHKLIEGEWHYDDEMLNDIILKHVMEKEVFTLYPNQSLGKAIMKMTYSRCGCIPIVDHNHTLLGMLTRKDIIKTMARMYEQKYKREG